MDNAVNVSGWANVSVVLGFAELCNQPFVDGNKLPWELDEERVLGGACLSSVFAGMIIACPS